MSDSNGPTVEVVSVVPTERGHKLVCRFNEPYGEPIAPGGLYTSPESPKESFAVHRVASSKELEVTFESFGNTVGRLPTAGTKFFYRGWWVKAAMDAVLDEGATWEHRTYPNDGSHEHCLFTWETIASSAEVTSGYWSSTHGWVSEKAYKEFVLGDPLHMREPRDA